MREARVVDVPQDSRPCPFCHAPIGDDRKALALTAEGLRWGHTTCLIQKNGRGISLLIPGRQEVA